MSSTATVILTGVVYLSALPQPQPTILKAAVMQSEIDRVGTRGGVIPRHRAFIRVRKDQIANPGRIPDLEYIAVGDTATSYVFFLDGEKIEIEGASNTKLEFPATVPPKAPFAMVPHVQDFCRTCRLLTLAEFDTPDIRHVGARLDIQVGDVTAQALTDCEKWHFEAEFGYPAHNRGAIPREVAVDLAITNQLVLKMSPLPRSTKLPYTITFRSSIPVQVTVGSATLEDILGFAGPHGVDRTDHHFELFYYLLERSNQARHPLPVQDPSCTDFHRLNGVDCPPVQQ